MVWNGRHTSIGIRIIRVTTSRVGRAPQAVVVSLHPIAVIDMPVTAALRHLHDQITTECTDQVVKCESENTSIIQHKSILSVGHIAPK